MNRSESIGKLTEALAKAQACIKGAIKDSSNPFFKSQYADLSSVWEACRKQLTDNGLAIIQTTFPTDTDEIGLETTMSHISGEWVSGSLIMKPVKNDPQSIGSCITYMRRYALSAIVGIAPEDDDGNAASKPDQEPKKTKPQTETLKDKLKGKPEDITEEAKLFQDKCTELGMSTDEITAFKKHLFRKAPSKAELMDVITKFTDLFDEFISTKTGKEE